MSLFHRAVGTVAVALALVGVITAFVMGKLAEIG